MDAYCPKCGERLTALTVGARGCCERHGWVNADYDRPASPRVLDRNERLIRKGSQVVADTGAVIGTVERLDDDEFGPVIVVRYLTGEEQEWPCHQEDPLDTDPDVFVCDDVRIGG